MPFGNFLKKQMLSQKEFYASTLFIAKQKIIKAYQDLPLVGAHCYGYCSQVLPGARWQGYTAGISTVGITGDGGIVDYLFIGNDRFFEDNVREQSFKQIWNNPNIFAFNRQFNKNKAGPNCLNCKHLKNFRGGCNSMSYSLTQKFNNNPYCFYSFEQNQLKA
ncbi:MAG: SPASM domain-containing protein [Candidatus Moranbacteria bacterium]|nr:SPASM domain-containing protein [Candidatus Moranbacteria bacterium]